MEARENKTDPQTENTPACLRRLRIQQNILQKGIKHLYSKFLEDDYSIGNNLLFNKDDQTYFGKIKKIFTEIKNLYEDIKFFTEETNTGKTSDIDEIRKNILSLESKIKEFKKYLQHELETLGEEEIALNEDQINNKKMKTVSSTMPSIKLIAPSPVKVLIESPLKCLEVQKFQEFMKRKKRNGGWNEYDHNKFIQIWNTYYGCPGLDNTKEIDMNSETCLKLINELADKIVGSNREDIVSHIEWYIQYLELYTCQKNALNKWKDNRNKIKKYKKLTNYQNEEKIKSTENNMRVKYDKTQKLSSKCSENDSSFSNISASSENSSDYEEDEEKVPTPYKSKLMEPTKQWLYRCNDRNKTTAICNIETVKKLFFTKSCSKNKMVRVHRKPRSYIESCLL